MRCSNCGGTDRAEHIEEDEAGVIWRKCQMCNAWSRLVEDISLPGLPRFRMELAEHGISET